MCPGVGAKLWPETKGNAIIDEDPCNRLGSRKLISTNTPRDSTTCTSWSKPLTGQGINLVNLAWTMREYYKHIQHPAETGERWFKSILLVIGLFYRAVAYCGLIGIKRSRQGWRKAHAIWVLDVLSAAETYLLWMVPFPAWYIWGRISS